MPENNSGSYFITPDDNGSVRISEEVVASIVSTAIGEVDGVAGLVTPITESLAGILGRKFVPGAIKITPAKNTLSVDLAIRVKYGFVINDLCRAVQKRVADAVESMTGIQVTAVNIQVAAVSFDTEPKPADPGENSPAAVPVSAVIPDAETEE